MFSLKDSSLQPFFDYVNETIKCEDKIYSKSICCLNRPKAGPPYPLKRQSVML